MRRPIGLQRPPTWKAPSAVAQVELYFFASSLQT